MAQTDLGLSVPWIPFQAWLTGRWRGKANNYRRLTQ